MLLVTSPPANLTHRDAAVFDAAQYRVTLVDAARFVTFRYQQRLDSIHCIYPEDCRGPHGNIPCALLAAAVMPFFPPAGAEAFRRDNPEAVVKLPEAGYLAPKTHVTAVAESVRSFVGRSGGEQI